MAQLPAVAPAAAVEAAATPAPQGGAGEVKEKKHVSLEAGSKESASVAKCLLTWEACTNAVYAINEIKHELNQINEMCAAIFDRMKDDGPKAIEDAVALKAARTEKMEKLVTLQKELDTLYATGSFQAGVYSPERLSARVHALFHCPGWREVAGKEGSAREHAMRGAASSCSYVGRAGLSFRLGYDTSLQMRVQFSPHGGPACLMLLKTDERFEAGKSVETSGKYLEYWWPACKASPEIAKVYSDSNKDTAGPAWAELSFETPLQGMTLEQFVRFLQALDNCFLAPLTLAKISKNALLSDSVLI